MLKTEIVHIRTKDGLNLPGILYSIPKSRKAVIYLHGNGTSSVFYDEETKMKPLAEELAKKGITFLAFNNRGAHLVKRLNQEGEPKRYNGGMSFERIKDCTKDIDGAINFLKKKGFREFYLAGISTGANKICVYDHFRPKNEISKYIPLSGGDDTGIYYRELGKKKFWELLRKAKRKISQKKGEELMPEILDKYVFSYQGFYDIANPDGDYNCFPFLEALKRANLSKKPLFRYFKALGKPSLTIYGENDEYAWGNVPRIVEILKRQRPDLDYAVIKNADHGFRGYETKLGKMMAEWLSKS